MRALLTILLGFIVLPFECSAVTLSYKVTEADLKNLPVLVERQEEKESIHISLYIHKSAPFISGPSSMNLVLRNKQSQLMFSGVLIKTDSLDGDRISIFSFRLHRDLVKNSTLSIYGILPSSHVGIHYDFSVSGLLKISRKPLTGTNPIQKFFKDRTFDAKAFYKRLNKKLGNKE